jgi:hypothetical protein
MTLSSADSVNAKVISGEVGTNILKNDVNRKLPEGTSLLGALIRAN